MSLHSSKHSYIINHIYSAGVYFTGGSLNPARSFGPAVANRHFPTHHWIYWIGPALGAIIAGGYYKFAKYFEYEEANPGQDDNEKDVERKSQGSMSRSGSGPASRGFDAAASPR